MAIRRIKVGGVSRDIYDARIDAIVTTLSSASTDDEIPSAKCVYDNLGSGGGGGITGVGVTAIVAISESDYVALATKDPTTLYIVTPDAV